MAQLDLDSGSREDVRCAQLAHSIRIVGEDFLRARDPASQTCSEKLDADSFG